MAHEGAPGSVLHSFFASAYGPGGLTVRQGQFSM